MPQAAQWLQQYYSAPEEAPTPIGSGEEKGTPEDGQAEASAPNKQELFKQAVKADREALKPEPPQVS